jgi:hypothetical protein
MQPAGADQTLHDAHVLGAELSPTEHPVSAFMEVLP